MKLSVVDQSPIPSGLTANQAFHNTIELAQYTERLGYERYWMAEHHGTEALACSAPEIMIARVAAETSTIRVGSGAVLLPHYAALKIAEVFRVLHALYPDRIDLGIGRAPGSRPLEAFALQRVHGQNPVGDDFPHQLAELLAFLRGSFPEGHSFSQIHVTPEAPGGPELWLLGSSLWSASAASQIGLPYAFAHFINPEHTREAIDYYHENVRRDAGPGAGRTILSVGVICADTEAEAERLYLSRRLLRMLNQEGYRGPLPTPEEALARLGPNHPLPPPDRGEWPRYIVGDPEQVRDRLTEMVRELKVDELMAITVVHDHAARLRSYELLADCLGLKPRAVETTA